MTVMNSTQLSAVSFGGNNSNGRTSIYNAHVHFQTIILSENTVQNVDCTASDTTSKQLQELFGAKCKRTVYAICNWQKEFHDDVATPMGWYCQLQEIRKQLGWTHILGIEDGKEIKILCADESRRRIEQQPAGKEAPMEFGLL